MYGDPTVSPHGGASGTGCPRGGEEMQGLRCALLALVVGVSQAALRQVYPAKPIKIVVPYPPGASTDTVARAVAQKLTDSMGQQVFVENRAGASGNIGADYVAKSPPDGYTILMGTDAT